MNNGELEYAGFWIRVLASVIDTVLLMIISLPLLRFIYGPEYFDSDQFVAGQADFLISYLIPALAVIFFWIYRQATPGKMAISARILDAETGEKPSVLQCFGRYFAYIPSILFFGLGVFWVAFDRRKQGWHDKLAGTVVVRKIKTAEFAKRREESLPETVVVRKEETAQSQQG